jgi:hypothetical protein
VSAPKAPAKLEPIVPHYICRTCNRRHSTRTAIGQEHLDSARAPKRGR